VGVKALKLPDASNERRIFMLKHKNKIIALTVSALLTSAMFSSIPIKAVQLTDDQLYFSAYALTSNAINSKAQRSINFARKDLAKLPSTLDWAKAEFSRQLDMLQDNLMKNSIAAYYKAAESGLPTDIHNANLVIDELRYSDDANIAAWANSLKAQVGSIAYDKAIDEISNKVYSLPNVAERLKKDKKLKIAFWGDSITEGVDNYPEDTYPQLLINNLKTLMPDIEIEYTNFSLGTRNTYNAIDDNYKAHAEKEHYWPWTQGYIDFFREWSIPNKSWKQHVVDYKADLVIVAFGMNDSTNNLSDNNFIKNIDSMVSYLKENSPSSDIALVTNIMPTEDKTLYSQGTEYTLQVARALREYAKANGMPLIDANRLWSILLYGRDEEKYVLEEVTDIKKIENKVSYNFELQVKLSKYPIFEQAAEISARANGTNGGISFKLYQSKGENYISIHSMDKGINNEGLEIATIKARDINTIKLDGAKLTVNDSEYLLYKHLRDGIIKFVKGKENIASIKLVNKNIFSQLPLYNETALLGKLNDDLPGNGINHPNDLGTYLSYFKACSSLINSIKAEYDGVSIE
jgi:lysophospholipase L1-like esterase